MHRSILWMNIAQNMGKDVMCLLYDVMVKSPPDALATLAGPALLGKTQSGSLEDVLKLELFIHQGKL